MARVLQKVPRQGFYDVNVRRVWGIAVITRVVSGRLGLLPLRTSASEGTRDSTGFNGREGAWDFNKRRILSIRLSTGFIRHDAGCSRIELKTIGSPGSSSPSVRRPYKDVVEGNESRILSDTHKG
jgi:hypothetical protein